MAVEPIRDIRKIDAMYNYLKGTDPRGALLFKLGINTARRISDLVKANVSDFITEKGYFRERWILIEQKTKKEAKVRINDELRKLIKEYIKQNNLSYDDYLFPSRVSPYMSTVQAWRILKTAAEAVGIESFGTHSMRKTWGYHQRKMGTDLAIKQESLGHSHPAVTKRYIGITQDEVDNVYDKLRL
jgi:integrase